MLNAPLEYDYLRIIILNRYCFIKEETSNSLGEGVYKSSARNAMRVARTKTNMAYRKADNERWVGAVFSS